MILEQLIFTSVRSRSGSGYQVAGHSAGLSAADIKELCSRSPSHDSLVEAHAAARSVNWFCLESGRYCVGLTQHAGPEASGRGGYRVYTHWLMGEAADFPRFNWHPFRLLASVQADEPWQPWGDIPERLPTLSLRGTSQWFSPHALRQVLLRFPAETLVAILDRLMQQERVVVFVNQRQESLVTALLDVLPLPARQQLSFSTGLRYSPQRDYQLLVIPRPPCAADRSSGLKQHSRFDLHRAERPPNGWEPSWAYDCWAARLLPLLKQEQFADIAQALGQWYEPFELPR